MKSKLNQILSIIVIGVIVTSCSLKKSIEKYEDNTINILKVDSLKFMNYYTCEFESKNNIIGYLLIKKSKTNLTAADLMISEPIHFDNLWDVFEFQPHNSEITFRGHATISRIYEDEELIIDLRNDIEKRYFQLCYGVTIDRKNN